MSWLVGELSISDRAGIVFTHTHFTVGLSRVVCRIAHTLLHKIANKVLVSIRVSVSY